MAIEYCKCSEVSSSTSTGCVNGACISAPHMLVINDTSVDPCGETKTILWDDCLDLCGCGDTTASYRTETTSSNLTNVSVNSSGVTFTSNASDASDYLAEITYIVSCGQLSVRGSVTIVFNNPCLNVSCNSGYSCDYCTGNCVADGADIDVT